jgi:hypothetical protein
MSGSPEDLSGVAPNDIEDLCGKQVLKACPTLSLTSGL